jgi:AI-2 transport protein TqsA
MPEAKDNTTLVNVAFGLFVVAVSWYLLQQLAILLRPLLLATFLAYIILPLQALVVKRGRARLSTYLLLAGTSIAILYGLALLMYYSVVELSEELPRLVDRGEHIYHDVSAQLTERLPWLAAPGGGLSGPEPPRLHGLANQLMNTAAEATTEALVVGFYLLFLLLEAHRWPHRVRAGFTGERAAEILEIAGQVNEAIALYLKAKTKASLALAVPVTLVLWVCGVKFPLLWGVLTFLCNFIPYLGSVLAVTVPLAFGFLDLYPSWQPWAAAVGVLATHLTVTYIVEPTLTSRAVGISPLVILFSLAFWGACWGFIGMFLAVPLTVVAKIVLEHIEFTRPFAELLGDRAASESGVSEAHRTAGLAPGENTSVPEASSSTRD